MFEEQLDPSRDKKYDMLIDTPLWLQTKLDPCFVVKKRNKLKAPRHHNLMFMDSFFRRKVSMLENERTCN